MIDLSVVRIHLVRFSVQVKTWWWSKSSRGLIGTEGVCIGFIEIVALVGSIRLIHLLFRQHLSSLPILLSNPPVKLSFCGVSSLGIIYYRHSFQFFSSDCWRYWYGTIISYSGACSFKNKYIFRNTIEFFPYYYRLYICASLPWFLVVFFCHYMFSPCILIWTLIIINDFIWSILLRNITVLTIFFI